MRSIDPKNAPTAEVHRYLLACVAPRPIALVSTVDVEGRQNLAPFSFFNAFGANPPVVAFSPAFRGLDGSSKHTFDNVLATREFTVSVVSYELVHRTSYASADWPRGESEFESAGLTPAASTKVTPPGVAESPMFMECRLLQHVALGDGPGSGQLMIGEVIMFHLHEAIFDGPYPDYKRLDLVARMGGPHYARANGEAVFTIPKPGAPGLPINALPEDVRTSPILTGEDLARLAAVAGDSPIDLSSEESFPELEGVDLSAELRFASPERLLAAWRSQLGHPLDRSLQHSIAQRLIGAGLVAEVYSLLSR